MEQYLIVLECVAYNKIRLQIDPFGKHFIDGHPDCRFFLFFENLVSSFRTNEIFPSTNFVNKKRAM